MSNVVVLREPVAPKRQPPVRFQGGGNQRHNHALQRHRAGTTGCFASTEANREVREARWASAWRQGNYDLTGLKPAGSRSAVASVIIANRPATT
jgi:hypothetical protein